MSDYYAGADREYVGVLATAGWRNAPFKLDVWLGADDNNACGVVEVWADDMGECMSVYITQVQPVVTDRIGSAHPRILAVHGSCMN